jgi:N-acyl-D-aspartate/D-glutamate deacylase
LATAERFDTLIQNAKLVDGSCTEPRLADVAIAGGRIAAIAEAGSLDASRATEIVNASGLILTPGFIDPHTHYDAQLFWDPFATPSTLHGVTTVVGGNCGFSIAPLSTGADGTYLRNMLAKVEGMPLAALEAGLTWDWKGFGDYLSRFEGKIGVNAAFLVGHCALRRAVMGDRSVGNEANAEELAAMVALLHASIEAGGLGFSTSLSFTHTDGDGEPVPSRWASHEEVLALCAVLREHEGTTLEFIVDGCLTGFTEDEIELVIEMSLTAERPANWNVLTVEARSPDRLESQLQLSVRAAEKGARVVGLTMPIIAGMCSSFGVHSALHSMPGWGYVMTLPIPERINKLRDAEVRRDMNERANSKEAGVFAGLARWGGYRIGTTFSAENAGLEGRFVEDIAAERGTGHFDTLLDIVIADDLRTVLWPAQPGEDDESWMLRRQVWDEPGIMLGGSDAGAHIDRLCGSNYPTEFLRDVLHGRKLVSLERAVAMMTSVPAELFGFRDRGLIVEGGWADLVLLNPETIGTSECDFANDLPGEAQRLIAGSTGIERVWLNGQLSIVNGEPVGELAGRVLHPGRDTRTASMTTI